MQTITILDGRSSNWIQQLGDILRTGRNFLIVLKPDPAEHANLCRLIACDRASGPERLGRWGIHALNDVLEPSDYEKLLKIHSNGDAICFVEQLFLKHNRPPALKPFMVYCEVRGIISHHDTLEEAKTAFFHYLESFRRARLFLMVGIYAWQEERWQRLRTVF